MQAGPAVVRRSECPSHGQLPMMIAQDQVPPTPEEFSHLLATLDCAIHAIHGDQLVLGVALNEDVQAEELR